MPLTTVITAILVYAALIAASLSLYLALTFLKPFKKAAKAYAFPDLLDYAYITDDDVVLLKNGAMMRVFSIEHISQTNCTPMPCDVTKRLEQLTQARKNLGAGYMLNYDLISESDSSDDDIRYKGHINGYKLFKKRNEVLKSCSKKINCFLTITKTADYSRLGIKKQKLNASCQPDSDAVKNFLDTTDNFAAILKSFELKPHSFYRHGTGSTHDTVNFLRKCISGRDEYIQCTKGLTALDLLLCSDDLKNSESLVLGGRHIGIVALDTVPDESYAGILNRLTSLPFDFRFSSRFISFDAKTSERSFNHYYRLWNQNKTSLLSQFLNIQNSRTNVNAQEQIREVEKCKAEFENHKLELCSYSANVIFFADSKEDVILKAREIGALLDQNGLNTSFGHRLESVNALEAYLGSLPGHCLENLRRAIIPDTVFADFIPVIDAYKGQSLTSNPLFCKDWPSLMTVIGENRIRSYLNLHIDALGNTLVAGPSGSGKSVLLGALIISLLRYEGMQVFAFDKGYSFYALTKALGGAHLTLDTDSDLKLCPFENLDNEDDMDRAMDFLEIVFRINKHDLNAVEKKKLKEALYEMKSYQGAGHSLSLFMSLVCNDDLNDILGKYACENSFLNGEHNVELDKNLTVFECGEFFSKSEQTVYPSLCTIFNQIDRKINQSKSSAIIIDEAWLMMQNPIFAQKLISWIKTVRKSNSLIIMATQSLYDFVRSGLIEDLKDNVKHRIFLPNADALNSSELYEKLSLGKDEIFCISKSVPCRDYISSSRLGFMKFELPLSQEELSLLTRTVKDKQVTDLLFHEHNEDFLWLKA